MWLTRSWSRWDTPVRSAPPDGRSRPSSRPIGPGPVRVRRPWITEPGMWLQYDYGDGPVIDGAKTVLFVAWLAWSRFRVVIALRGKTISSVFAAPDQSFRRLDGVPTYVLTDNEKTVTTEHIAGIPVRAAGRWSVPRRALSRRIGIMKAARWVPVMGD